MLDQEEGNSLGTGLEEVSRETQVTLSAGMSLTYSFSEAPKLQTIQRRGPHHSPAEAVAPAFRSCPLSQAHQAQDTVPSSRQPCWSGRGGAREAGSGSPGTPCTCQRVTTPLSARLFVLQMEHWPPESVGWEWGSVRGRVLSAGLAETICLALDVFPP